jgi:hypothetical protein
MGDMVMDKKIIHVWDFMNEFSDALKEQLETDEKRWGDTWLERTRLGQEDRTICEFNDYFDQWKNTNTPISWLKVVGNAMICWIREEHPELWEK